ncbi:hypothetical protein, conserved [Leishmania tarentolae]|uniref:Uncharacterized protein n=1 Tax=Leishmania tarentolae TaxID=5689 RepID=A0A640KLX4_LEITA|nr:hypothetical protein, conserved [Leishmania tarentolae]
MNRGVKRGRAETPSLTPSSRASSPAPSSESLPATTNVQTPPKREAKKYLADAHPLERADASSVHSDESVHMESSREREDAVFLEGCNLSGDALKHFLQKNFVDYINDELFDVAALEALED